MFNSKRIIFLNSKLLNSFIVLFYLGLRMKKTNDNNQFITSKTLWFFGVLMTTVLFSFSQTKKIVGNTLVYVNESDTTVTRDSTATEKFDVEKYFNPNMSDEERAMHKKNIVQFSERIENNPNDINAYVNRGAYFAYMGLYVEAIKDYDKAIDLYPDIPEVYYNRSLAKARFMFTLDACRDMKKASDLGMDAATEVLEQNCRRHIPRLNQESETANKGTGQ